MAAVGLKQESVVEIEDRMVTVVSEILLDPEALIMTRVLTDAGAVLNKSHTALPAAAVKDYASRGDSALVPSLHAHHLRFLRRLLSADAPPSAHPPANNVRAGVLATLTLGPAGEVLRRAGEDQVPAGWMRAAYLAKGMCDLLSTKLRTGAFGHGRLLGGTLTAKLSQDGANMLVEIHDVPGVGTESRVSSRGTLTWSQAASKLDVLVHGRGIDAAAVFASDRSVLHRGFGDVAAHLKDVAAGAKHLFSDVVPPVVALHLTFASCTIYAIPFDDAVVFLRGQEGVDIERVLATTTLESVPRIQLVAAVAEAPLAEEPAEASPSEGGLSRSNRLLSRAREYLGGPVIRNYLKRARNELLDVHPSLATFEVDLKGQLAGAEDDAALAAWMRRFLQQAKTVAPDLGRIDPAEFGLGGDAR